jgi:hypothetical protein
VLRGSTSSEVYLQHGKVAALKRGGSIEARLGDTSRKAEEGSITVGRL